MKKALVVLLLAIGALAFTVTPGDAHGHFRGGVFIGVGPYWGPYPYWWYPPPYYAYPTYVYPPSVMVEQPPAYLEQQPGAPAAPPASTAYWYYCASAKAYYPTAPSCPEEWVKVPERPR